jgi:hypothetical protein
VLAESDARRRSELREPANETPRLQGAVRRMKDRTTELGAQMRQLVTPLRGEAVFVQSFVLRPDLAALLVVCGKTKAPGPPKRIARNRLEPIERTLRPPPQLFRRVCTVRLARDVVAGSTAAQREPSVPATRTLRDPAGIVHAHA